MAIKNDGYSKQRFNWSSRRNSEDRLRHRPHVVNSANNRGSSNVRYFSSVDADIYFGEVFIDEVVSIAWQLQQNTMPLYGYASYTFDDIAVGNRVITGQFAVNYTESNYLTKVMSAMSKISRKFYNSEIVTDNPATSGFSEADKIRRNTPLWDAGFDIKVGYGEKNSESYESLIILDCCQITGCTQQLDYNGEPVVELYSFIARDMKFSQVATREGSAKSIGSSNSSSVKEIEIENTKAKSIEELSIIDSTIFINGSNRHAKIEIEETDKLLTSYLFIRGVDDRLFAIGKEGKISGSTITFHLTNEEKKVLAKYADGYGNRIQADIKYGMNINGKAISKDITIIFKVTS